MKKNSIIITVIIVAVVALAIFLMRAPSITSEPANIAGGATETDWVKGNIDAKVTLIEYSDFQCPACGAFYPIIKQIEAEFGDRIALVYRHFPLRQIHANAEATARAAEAAGKQGKFWEMHDLLFERQADWSNQLGVVTTVTQYAEELGLNIEQFETDLASDEIKDNVNDDLQSALKAGFNSTPTFVLNGQKLSNPRNFEQFVELINDALATERE